MQQVRVKGSEYAYISQDQQCRRPLATYTECERERDREGEPYSHTLREKDKEREKERETDRQRDRQRKRDRERESERASEGSSRHQLQTLCCHLRVPGTLKVNGTMVRSPWPDHSSGVARSIRLLAIDGGTHMMGDMHNLYPPMHN